MIASLWDSLWPNMVAPSVWTIAAIIISHYRTHRKLRAQHEALKQHVSQEVSR